MCSNVITRTLKTALPLALVALVGALSSSAEAKYVKTKPRELGNLPSVPLSDGSRYVAWVDGGFVRLVDTAERERRRIAIPENCGFQTVGANHLVFLCLVEQSEQRCGSRVKPVFYSLATGESSTPPNIDAFYAQQGSRNFGNDCAWYPDEWSALGTRWFEYQIGAFPYWDRWFLDWRNGGDPVRQAEDPHSIIDLDEPDRLRALCAPLRRKPDPDDDSDESPSHPFLDAQLRGKRALMVNERDDLFLHRCGSRKRRRLSRVVDQWGLLRGGVAYWADDAFIDFYLIREDRRVTYELPIRGGHRQIAATGYRMYVTESDSWDPSIRTTRVVKVPR